MSNYVPEFKAWPKIPRVKGNNVTVSEKIDGTNACVIIEGGKLVGVQSRSRMIKPGDDNFGFAFWVHENSDQLAAILGDGYHYGEWAGPGIQKNPHELTEKTFFLFNTFRPVESYGDQFSELSISVVPLLYHGPYDEEVIEELMMDLKNGKIGHAVGGKPEGIVLYYHDTRSRQKMTFEFSEGKWKEEK